MKEKYYTAEQLAELDRLGFFAGQVIVGQERTREELERLQREKKRLFGGPSAEVKPQPTAPPR